ncbi:DUF6089 family protein [Porphyromonadaceae sp. NP-X]|nr:DUF6089 family protein [Porphyromonadaceae sp. NP-X]
MMFNKSLRRNVLVLLLILLVPGIKAQDDYLAEIGVAAGNGFYLGDANGQPFKNPTTVYGGTFRYRFNPRTALRTEWNHGVAEGKYINATNETVNFSNSLNAFDICGEFNFFDLMQKPNNRNSKRYSTYVFAGLGTMIYPSDSNKTSTAISIPFGVGFKYKVSSRFNVNLQWSMRWINRDDLEGVSDLNNPHSLNGSNPLNKDFFSAITLGITFDFLKKPCDCKSKW